MNDISHAEFRRRRVRRLKRIIVTAFFIFMTIPLALAIWLGCRLYTTSNELAEITAQYMVQLSITDELNDTLDERSAEADELKDKLNEAYDRMAEMEADNEGSDVQDVRDIGDFKDDGIRHVYLTFDDGPSIYTGKILDILDKYGVKATFFVTGEEAETNPERYRAIVERGHSIGMHSFTHVYSDVYKNKDNFIKDFNKIRDYISETTGVTPEIYRFPGGSSNTVSATDMDELCDYLTDEGIVYFDWNISSGDASHYPLSADRIKRNCLKNVANFDNAVILMHDVSTKGTTVEALPGIIEGILDMEDTEILPITKDTVPIQHRKSKEIE
ncbi:MAG: polysaccharide deacetylase [Lachnospiraceae bacterium]|nr:polysaccharide deacetylase [Lachnospiraceae bacterium]